MEADGGSEALNCPKLSLHQLVGLDDPQSRVYNGLVELTNSVDNMSDEPVPQTNGSAEAGDVDVATAAVAAVAALAGAVADTSGPTEPQPFSWL